MQTAVRRSWVFVLPVLVVAVLVMVFAKRLSDVEISIRSGAGPANLPSVLLNTPMPEFDLPPLPDRPPGLATTDLKGEVSLVNIWGSWCVACLAEHPILMDLAAEDAVPIHGVAWRDEPRASLAWLKRNGDPYTRIGQDPVSEVAIALGVTGAPETFIVDANGIIRYKHIGPITPQVWQDTLAPLIADLRR